MKITIIGSGAFGTAIALPFLDNNNQVIIYGIDQEQINKINDINNNLSQFFPFFIKKKQLKATINLEEALIDCEILVLAIPIRFLKVNLHKINNFLLKTNKQIYILNLIKGIEHEDGDLVNIVVKNNINADFLKVYFSLFGPTFAHELINKKKTFAVLYSENIFFLMKLKKLITTDYLKIEIDNKNLNAAETIASYKNLIAIASGLLDNKDVANNTRFAIISKAYEEIIYVCNQIFNSDWNFFFKLGTLGDLMLTSFSSSSRNYRFGKNFFQKNNQKKNETIEGLDTLKALSKFFQKKNLEFMPIFFEKMNSVLNENKNWEILLDLTK